MADPQATHSQFWYKSAECKTFEYCGQRHFATQVSLWGKNSPATCDEGGNHSGWMRNG